MNTAPLCTVIMVTLFAFPFLGAITDAHTQIPKMLCNATQFTDGSLFDKTLSDTTNSLMTGIVEGRVVYPFLAESCDTDFFMEAYCKESLGTHGCIDCFNAIKHGINKMCRSSLGVQATLQDCNLRYETYSFDQIEEKLNPFGKCPGTTS